MLPRNTRISKILNNFGRCLNTSEIFSGEHGSLADGAMESQGE